MRHLRTFEDLSAWDDPSYGNKWFKISYKKLDDLSLKKGSDLKRKPIDGPLDVYQEGDIVVGLNVLDNKEHTGMIVRIEKDDQNRGERIFIEDKGDLVELKPSSVKFTFDGDKGNVIYPIDLPPNFADPEKIDHWMYESKRIKKYSDF